MTKTVGFVAEQLFEPTLPARFGPLLRDLRAFADGSVPLAATHASLMREGRALAAGTDPVPRTRVLTAFAAGVLRATRLEATVEGGPRRQASSLDRFVPDYRAEDEASLRAALQPLLTPAGWSAVEQRLQAADRTLEARRAVVSALHARHPSDAPAAVHEALSELFVGHPLAAGEVGWIRTATSTFFLVPFAQGQLTELAAPLEGREIRVQSFVDHLDRFEQRYFAHFPVFGGFRGERSAPELLDGLARNTGLEPAEVAGHLTASVSILPRDDVDRYLVHDAWGHVWQALLFRFDESYRAAAGFDAPPALDERHAGATLAEVARAAAAGLPAPSPEAYLRACLHNRLHVALAGLMAEVLADAIESKVVGPPLPSSSRLTRSATRLDLSLSDLPYYFEVATSGVRALANDPDRLRAPLETILPPWEARAAAETLAAAARPLVDEVFAPRFHAALEGERVRVNVFDRVALNFLGFQAAVNARFPAAAAEGRADALLFALASHLEDHWARHFWHLDEMLEHLDGLLEHLPSRARGGQR